MPTRTLKKEVTFTRVYDAPLQTVWNAWTDAKALAKWWGPRGFTNPTCEIDPRPGGKIHIVMRGPDGTDYPMEGEFRQVETRRKLVFFSAAVMNGTKHLESTTTVTFAKLKNKTKLTVKASAIGLTPESAAMLGGMKEGWSQSLDKLDEAVVDTSAREIRLTRTFDAPREMVFDAMTDPKQLPKWFGPDGFTITIKKMDVRPGGEWTLTMHGPDGKDYPNKSHFLEVVRPERVVYQHGGGAKGKPGANFLASWIYEAVGATQTKLTLLMVFPTTADRDLVVKSYNAIEGGRQTLARLAKHLEGIR